MQSICLNNRPQVYRVVRTPSHCSPKPNRNMAFFPRAFASELMPALRLFDEIVTSNSSRAAPAFTQSFSNNNQRTFQPRFDVRENKDSYELLGELPGIQQRNINIEFTDASTLSISGSTQSAHEEGTKSSGLIDNQAEQTQSNDAQSTATDSEAGWDTVTRAESDAPGYHKATVEDEGAESATTNATATEAEPTPAPEATPQPEGPKYWLSERSSGSFARTFSFADRVDHDSVKASLTNGILSIVVPKAAIPAARRIVIQ